MAIADDADDTDEEDDDEQILQRVVLLETRLARKNLKIREILAIAAIETAEECLALLRHQRQQKTLAHIEDQHIEVKTVWKSRDEIADECRDRIYRI